MLNKYEHIVDSNSPATLDASLAVSALEVKESGRNPLYNYKYRYLRVPLRDSRSQNIIAHFEECFQFIDEARCNQAKVLVHCHQGNNLNYALYLEKNNVDNEYDNRQVSKHCCHHGISYSSQRFVF